jgi:hypothetical protein
MGMGIRRLRGTGPVGVCIRILRLQMKILTPKRPGTLHMHP